MKKKKLQLALSLTVLLMLAAVNVTKAQSNPLRDPNTCGKVECKETGKFGYYPGIQHIYNYTVNVSSLFEGTSKNESSLHITASVRLDFISLCDGVLRVTDVILKENRKTTASTSTAGESRGSGENEEKKDSDENLSGSWLNENGAGDEVHENSEAFADAISEHSLRFAFKDGVITEVCPGEDESNWVLNFKRGILSMIHNSMERFDLDYESRNEEDVRGRCMTHYKVQGAKGTSLIVEKFKDLSSCTHHSKLHSMIQTTPYNFRVNYKGRNLLRSTSKCELSIDHRIYNDISCEESHVFEPFSNQATGATTLVSQRLTLTDEIADVPEQEQEAIERRTSLLYDHVPTPKPTSGELKASRDLIKKLCRVTVEDVQMEFSDLFVKFIHTARSLSVPGLKALYDYSSLLCPTGKKHMLDALPYLGSSASVDLMKDIILNRTVSESTRDEWIMSIAMVPTPDESMLMSALALMETKKDSSVLLGVSSLVYTFCKQNANCRTETESVDGIIQLLEDRVIEAYNSGKKDRETQETILVSLKALANIGLTSESFKKEQRSIIEDEHIDVAIRVAAIDAHRRLPCDASPQYFEELFRNENQDPEVRIAAYLQIMRCPNYLVVRTIRHALETEQVNQVGSFIWSHLHNLLKSSIPSRVEIQGLLSDKDLTKKFSSDVRKFSQNYEGSVFFEEYNVGGLYEGNIIFSPTSYIPRSAMLNLTVDLFGESINLLEVYGRIEGFEHYAESIFGPTGPYSSKNVQRWLPKMRWGRDTDDRDGEHLKNQIGKLSHTLDNDFGAPQVALGMKLFGNELKYATFRGDEEIWSALRALNPMEHLARILSGRDINYSKASMFLDTSFSVSTGAGFAVSLNAIGTTSINMQLRGSLSGDNFIKTREMDIAASIRPNIALDIMGTMSVDAYFARTAIKLKTSMYTSSAIDGHVKIRGARLISVKFGLPKKVQEIFGAKSELIVMKGRVEELQAGINKALVSESVCSWPAVEKTLGLKLCADYHFENVTEMSNAPHFIMAGPAGFKLSLQKSDPKATTYLLEYKWNELPTSSYMSLTLDTPGSSIPRIMGANLTLDNESQNLTLLLRSTEGTVLARGKYKNTDMEKSLHLGLDINNQKNFDVLLSLDKKVIRNGFLYDPKVYLGINEERVAELMGNVKLVTKAGISQYEVDLKFKTKRLNSKLFGYVSLKRDSEGKQTLTTTLKLDYRFVNTREHVVMLDFTLADHSKHIFRLDGDMRLETTAYPNYNFNSTFKVQRSDTHLEISGILNASPHLRKKLEVDPEMLTIQMFLTYRSLTNNTRFNVSASLTRPSTELDVKGQLLYDVTGYSTNAMVLARYAKGKDVVVTVYWNHPRQTLENYEGRLNVTIPAFTPMVLEGKLKEKNSLDYMLELRCTWFSGHKVDVKGLYHDRSTNLASDHHLKLLIRSPSFIEINADCHYYRNNTMWIIDVQADQDDENYSVYLLHSQKSPYEIRSSGELRYKSKLYSISSSISLKEKREITLELHIDQLRDIYFSLWAHNKGPYKEAGFEVKWDANRDPNQKLVVTIHYENVRPYNYDANFHVAYPGRNIKGYFNFLLEGGHFSTSTGVAWSPDDALTVALLLDFKNDEQLVINCNSELVTPFDEWRKTSLSGGLVHSDNMYRINGSMYWQHDQHVSINLFGDYAANDAKLKCEFMGSLNSTVEDIPSLSISFRHDHNATKVDSDIEMSYQPKQKIAITSSWQIDENSHMKNLTGTVTLVSPFKGFNKGLLVSKIYVTSSRDLRGVANLDMDHREFSASVEGHFQKLSKSTLEFNITTPLEKFKLIEGRFGFHEEQRHLIAKIEYSSGKLGLEILFAVNSLADFDVKFNVATPLEFLQEILLVAKLKKETIDFRIGWNSLLGGVSGVWHYANITDFNYAYKIYLPIDGFEENGVVAKVNYKEGIDVELFAKFATNKLGVIVQGKSNPTMLKELGIRTQSIYNYKLNANRDSPFIENLLDESSSEEEEEDEEEDDENEYEFDEEDPMNWSGYVEINSLIYPKITAEIDIDQKGTVYDVMAILTLPDGKAELRNEFDFIDVFTIKNQLSLTTPYKSFKVVTSGFELRIMMEHQYLLVLDLNYLNGTQWTETGGLVHYYTKKIQSAESIYNATIHLHTPFEIVPLLDVRGEFGSAWGKRHINFALTTNNSLIHIESDIQMYEDYLNIKSKAEIFTSIFILPASRMSFMKDFSQPENRIECYYTMIENTSNNYKLSTGWKYKSWKNVNARLLIETPLSGLERTEVQIEFYYPAKRSATLKTKLYLHPVEISGQAVSNNGDIIADFTIDISGESHRVDFNGTIHDVEENKCKIIGFMTIDDRKHNVSSLLEIDADNDGLPKKLDLNVSVLNVNANESSGPLTLIYEIESKENGYYAARASLRKGDMFADLNAHTKIRDKFDWVVDLQIETSHQIYKTFVVNAKAVSSDVNRSITFDAKTPFERLGKIQMGASLSLDKVRRITGFYDLGETGSSVDAAWSWLLFEDMSVKLVGNYRKQNYKRDVAINAFYVNPNKAFSSFEIGARVDLDNDWASGSNITLSRPERGIIALQAGLLLPKPNLELHSLRGRFNGTSGFKDIEYFVKYHTLKSGRSYSSSGNLFYRNLTNLNGNVSVEWNEKVITNYLDLHQRDDQVVYLGYKLRTPKFPASETLIADMSYVKWLDFHNITGELFYPGERNVGVVRMKFKEFANMNGFINVTTPFQGLNYTAADFATETSASVYNRYVHVYWPKNDAFLNSTCTKNKVADSLVERDTKGLILVEVPLATRHALKVDYIYSEKPLKSTGLANVDYNQEKVLEGKYKCLSESRAGFDKDTIHIEVENKLVPVGAEYIHDYRYGGPPGDGSSTPTVDGKYLRVYHLHNRSSFDVAGKVNVLKRETGQEITLTAIHKNHTVKVTSNYDVFNQQFKQYLRVDLSPKHWLAYDLDLLNKTTDNTFEAQQVQINLSYPRRNFTALASYNISTNALSSEMSLDWNKEGDETKTVKGEFEWKVDEMRANRHEVQLELMHPSLVKNVTIFGGYDRNDTALIDLELTVDYSPEPEQTFKMRGLVEDHSNVSHWNYTYGLWGSHPATNLQLDVRGGVEYKRQRFYSYHLVDYRRTYLPLQSGEATTRIDLDLSEIEMKRQTLHELSYLWGRYAGNSPLYTANVSAIHGKDINATGEFYLNFNEKLLQLELNMTTDGSQSLHMYGYIPDARNAYFDIWRDYEEDRITDVSYFLKLNHSRLVVASLLWRPELKQDIKDGIRAVSVGLYNHTMERSDYWRQYIRSETADAISDIWQDAKPLMQQFIEDVKDLRVIEEDLEELKVFLNESYYANEFYIKDVVNFMVYVIDELSIRSHIESLPVIVNEIWEVMGESGKKIQKGIAWVIENLKTYYKKAAEFINGLFQGDSLEHFSDGLKQLVEKYDNFIKDMHVAFIRYMEQLWKQTYKLLLDNWHKTLAAIEPTFIKFLHYLETITWNASKEVLDFLYIRNSEIIDNPYFSKISNFTHDLDRFYKDITGNDTIGSAYKYTKVAWNFLKEKYFQLVPFSNELQDIINEIVNEVYELKNLPSARFVIALYDEVEVKVKWFCDYFDVENRLHRFITLVHQKLTDMKQTALEAENRYREAKTKFIFEPKEGLMHLEQKLPMSWHAFNETPKFQEIPEYRTIHDIQNYFSLSKLSFYNFYYDYKPYAEISEWFPPFKAQAMLAGSQYYITFDGRVYDFRGECTYLLASDFRDGNFSIAVSYKGRNSREHELLVVINNTLIRIDLFTNSVKIGNDRVTRLPVQIGDAFLYQENELLTLESQSGYEMQCNMKFNVCIFEVSGWYFGKTAGLWGSMNNEPYDDLSTPNNSRLTINELERFAKSWSLDEECEHLENAAVHVENAPEEVRELCGSIYDSKVSSFASCFDRVSNKPFLDMCYNSDTKEGACASAVAYMKQCDYFNTPLRIPDACVRCNLVNGSEVSEGEFISMANETIPRSVDVVFIVEAKECNKDLRKRRRINEIVQQLDAELQQKNYEDNRYSVVVFGGTGVYDRPHSVIINSNVFTDHQLIGPHFDHIPIGNGSADILKAIAFATKLIFRPGVSKSFILLPCSNCKESNMSLDYSILHQLLLENDIALHILMNEEFKYRKTRQNKFRTVYGVDLKLGYGRKDAEKFEGNATLRQVVQLPKSTLHNCVPLALETNGSLFGGKKLESEKLHVARKIIAVFAKRVAQSAVSNSCKTCECTAHNSGVSYMECFPCTYPTPMVLEYGFNEDEMLSIMQPFDDDLLDVSY